MSADIWNGNLFPLNPLEALVVVVVDDVVV